jgi:5-formyltetrahydrofolate cyclo-ligase
MQFFYVNSLNSPDFSRGVGGVFEPVAEKARRVDAFQSTDLVLVPGLCFDNAGMRVGSGKGVYDRFLAHEGKLAQKWGVAFSPQVVPQNIECDAHDVLLDGLVTEKGFIYF